MSELKPFEWEERGHRHALCVRVEDPGHEAISYHPVQEKDFANALPEDLVIRLAERFGLPITCEKYDDAKRQAEHFQKCADEAERLLNRARLVVFAFEDFVEGESDLDSAEAALDELRGAELACSVIGDHVIDSRAQAQPQSEVDHAPVGESPAIKEEPTKQDGPEPPPRYTGPSAYSLPRELWFVICSCDTVKRFSTRAQATRFAEKENRSGGGDTFVCRAIERHTSDPLERRRESHLLQFLSQPRRLDAFIPGKLPGAVILAGRLPGSHQGVRAVYDQSHGVFSTVARQLAGVRSADQLRLRLHPQRLPGLGRVVH